MAIAAVAGKETLTQRGEITIEGGRMFVSCAENTWLEFLELQLEGKKRLSAAEFLRGNAIRPGARLGTLAS